MFPMSTSPSVVLYDPLLVSFSSIHTLLCKHIKIFVLLLFSHQVVSEFSVTPWIIACQAPLSMRFPSQEYWSELSFPSPEDLPNTGTKPTSPTLAYRFLTTGSPGKSKIFLFPVLSMLFQMYSF